VTGEQTHEFGGTSGQNRPRRTRRRLMGSLGGVTALGLAGCNGREDADDETTTDRTATDGGTTLGRRRRPTPMDSTRSNSRRSGRPAKVRAQDRRRSRRGRPLAGLVHPTAGALTEPRYPRVDLMHFRTIDFLVTDGAGYVARTHEANRRVDDSVDRRVVPVVDDALLYRHEFAAADDRRVVPRRRIRRRPRQRRRPPRRRLRRTGGLRLLSGRSPAISGATAGDAGIRVDDAGGYALGAQDAPTGGDVLDENSDLRGRGERRRRGRLRVGDRRRRRLAVSEGARRAGPCPRRRQSGGPSASRTGTSCSPDDSARATETTVALGFVEGSDATDATAEARRALDRGTTRYAGVRRLWRSFLDEVAVPDVVAEDDRVAAQYRTAAMTLRAVEDKTFSGAGIASPSVPWGEGVVADTRARRRLQLRLVARPLPVVHRTRRWVRSTPPSPPPSTCSPSSKATTGSSAEHLPRRPHALGREQLDNVAFPLVMASQLRERHDVDFADVEYDYADVKASADYVARSGPGTEQSAGRRRAGSPRARSRPRSRASRAPHASPTTRASARTHSSTSGSRTAGATASRTWCATTTGADGHDPPYFIRISDDRDPDDGTERSLANGGPTLDERAIIDAGFLELV